MTKTQYRTHLAERFAAMFALKSGMTLDAAGRSALITESFSMADAFMAKAHSNGDVDPWERFSNVEGKSE